MRQTSKTLISNLPLFSLSLICNSLPISSTLLLPLKTWKTKRKASRKLITKRAMQKKIETQTQECFRASFVQESFTVLKHWEGTKTLIRKKERLQEKRNALLTTLPR
ncbi:hypothetical protein ACFX12_035617 [Malus domestica]